MRKKFLWILAVLAAVGFLGVVVIDTETRTTFWGAMCRQNLRAIEAAKQQWEAALPRDSNTPMTWAEVAGYLGRNPATVDTEIRCPVGAHYDLGVPGKPPTCSLGGRDHSIHYDDTLQRTLDVLFHSALVLGVMGLLLVIFLVPEREEEK